MAITKNIVTDYGADDTGVAATTSAFYDQLKPAMAGQDCILTIPNNGVGHNSYNMVVKGSPPNFFWAMGMTSLDVTATGATLNNAVVIGAPCQTQVGIDAAGGKSARIKTVSAGTTAVELTSDSATAGHISRATVGQWMIVAGFDTQGLFLSSFGFPANHHFLDFVQITAVDTTNKIISFTPALSDSYSSGWPEFNRGNAFEVDAGGPATVYFIDAGWDHTVTWNGGAFNCSNAIGCGGRDFYITNVTHPSGLPINPSGTKLWRAINTDSSGAGTMEIDKYVDTAILDGGVHNQIQTQSSSCKNIYFRNLTVNNYIGGGGRNTTIENCVIGSGGLTIGCDGYGRQDTFVCRDTSISGSIGEVSAGRDTGNGVGVQDTWRMANGVITIPKSAYSELGKIFPPDSYGRNVLIWENGSSNTIGSFQNLAVTSDPWPAVDNQTLTTTINITSGTKTLNVPSGPFVAGDQYKVIVVNAAGNAGGTSALKTFITAVNSATDVTLYHAAAGTVASSQTIQWGTSNVYVQTNQSGGLPSSSLYGGTSKLYCRVPGARTVSFENVTGSADALDLSQAAARNRPLYSYTKRTYDGTTFGATGASVPIRGNVTSIKINVTTPYTGTQPTLTVGLAQFDNMTVVSGGALTTYGPRVNLKVAGERVITVGNTTGTQSGDTNLNISSAMWLCLSYRPSVSQNITGESASVYPLFTIEMITDQGFYTGPVAVAPLRLRLRA